MKLYFIAGEASGDLHASNLVKEIQEKHAGIEFRGWGGDLMQNNGVEIVKHYRDLAFMGFTEVLRNLRTILNNISFCKADIIKFKPDALVLIDYPGFNLRIAKFAKENNIPVYYYISPQVWAWKASRVKKIRELVNTMFVILPFEKEFYQKFNYEVEYVGHPLRDVIDEKSKSFRDRNSFNSEYNIPDKNIIALLPGSRRQEIAEMLPRMLSVVKDFPEYQFVVAGAPAIDPDLYEKHTKGLKVPVIFNNAYELLHHSEAALVTSGTATLETALLKVPEVVCYKGGRLSYLIAKNLIKIKFISLVNLIMDREIVKELIQDDLTHDHLENELKIILNPDRRKRMIDQYDLLIAKLNTGGASARVAKSILHDLKNKNIY